MRGILKLIRFHSENSGEMFRVLTLAMSRQWRVHAVVLFSCKNSTDY